MSREGNTDAMCAKFTRFDRMYSHQPAGPGTGHTVPCDGCEYINVSTDAVPPTWHGGHQHPQTTCFTQIRSSHSSASTCTVTRTRLPYPRRAPRATGVNTSTLALTRNASNLAWRSSTPPNIMFYADSVKPFLRFHLHGHSHAGLTGAPGTMRCATRATATAAWTGVTVRGCY